MTAEKSTAQQQPKLHDIIVDRLLGTFFDRSGDVPLHSWAKILQNFRASSWIRMGNVLVVVRSQTLQFTEHAVPAFAPYMIRGDHRLGRIGRTSIEFLTDIYAFHRDRPDEEFLVGRSVAIMVVTDATRERAAAVPEHVVVLHNDEPFPIRHLTRGVKDMRPSLDAFPPNVFRQLVHVRPSDEDQLQHVNQSSYLVFFYDTIELLRSNTDLQLQHQKLADFLNANAFPTVTIEYLKEATSRSGSPHYVILEQPDHHNGALDAYLVGPDVIHSRARFWASSSKELAHL